MLAMAALYLLAGMIREAGGSFLARPSSAGSIATARCSPAVAFLLSWPHAGLPPGSGLWPKVMLVKASLEAGDGWLAGAILVSGFLTTITLGRVFLLAFWRTLKPGWRRR